MTTDTQRGHLRSIANFQSKRPKARTGAQHLPMERASRRLELLVKKSMTPVSQQSDLQKYSWTWPSVWPPTVTPAASEHAEARGYDLVYTCRNSGGVSVHYCQYKPVSAPMRQREHTGLLDSEALRAQIAELVNRTVNEIFSSAGLGAAPNQPSVGVASTVPSDPLAAARARGVSYMKAQLELPENLNLDSAATYSGLSNRHINELRQKGDLYALVLEGNTRGYRYPQWQFDAERERLVPVLRSLHEKGLSCWAIHSFMMRVNEHLGRAPREGILDPDFPVDRITEAVGIRFSQADQGAA